MAATDAERSHPMEKWMAILDAFLEQDEWGVRDLSRHIDVPRSVVHRLLHEMMRTGILAEGTEPGRFRIGPTMLRLSALLTHRFDLIRVARPVLEETQSRSQETVVLTLYDPQRRQFCAVDAVESRAAIRYIWDSLRDWSHLHLGSSGKGILAFLDPAEQEAVLEGLPDPIPGPRPLPKQELRAQLAAARAAGYVVSRGERYSGAMGAAAPIYNALGRVAGSVIITAPEARMSVRPDAEWGAMVREAADRVSRALGFRPAAPS